MEKTPINCSNIRDLPKPDFIKWLVEEEDVLIAGVSTRCFRLEGDIDEEALQRWALHVRRHYIRDDELSDYVSFYETSTEEYLRDSCIPDIPQIMSGDFAEIMISDLLQFVEGYGVPRFKQHGRTDKNSSEHGSDVIAYKITDPEKPNASDELLAIEVKSRSASTDLTKAISDASKDSKKDRSRVAMTLSYYSMRSLKSGDKQTSAELRRFLKASEHPFIESFGIGAVAGVKNAKRQLDGRDASEFLINQNDRVFIIHKAHLMDLIREVYSRCIQ